MRGVTYEHPATVTHLAPKGTRHCYCGYIVPRAAGSKAAANASLLRKGRCAECAAIHHDLTIGAGMSRAAESVTAWLRSHENITVEDGVIHGTMR